MEATTAIQRALTSAGLVPALQPTAERAREAAPAPAPEAAHPVRRLPARRQTSLRAASAARRQASPRRRPRSGRPGRRSSTSTFTGAAGTRAFKLFEPAGFEDPAAAAAGHAARLHPKPRRLRRRHAHERAGPGARLLRPLSGAGAALERAQVLELVRAGRPATRPGRACPDRGMTRHVMRSHPIDPAPRLCRGALRGRRDGGDPGARISRSVRRRGNPFGRCGRRRTRRRVGLRGHEGRPRCGRRVAERGDGVRRRAAAGDRAGDRFSWRCRFDRCTSQRRCRHRGPARQRAGRRTVSRPRAAPAAPAGAFTARSGAAPPPMPRHPAWPNSGPSTARRMPGRAARPPAPSLIPAGPDASREMLRFFREHPRADERR